jgi:diaminohydroxyphosphoribosylaminopyrimidine deaminase/5-amino-6-(5-phosphoribosylamino)uracil reductase
VNAQDERIMRSALKLAEKGIGSVEPNPAVGCIITKASQEIGKGYHKQFGGPHAEINALENSKALGFKPEGGTMYVTLEPCCHEGKTGPCTQAIIEAGIKRVVVATGDPSPHANGKGIEQLRRAGIEVEVGLCEPEAKLINAPFFKYVTTGKCWVVLKWAQSIDGKLAFADQSPEKRWITNEASRNDAHKLRRRAGAVVVGIKTVLADDPMLTPRPSKGKKPIRIVLDDSLQIPLTCRLLRTTKTSGVLIYTREETAKADPKTVERITKKGAEVLTYPDTANGSNLPLLLESLGKRGIAQVLVEGGPSVLASFLKQGLADEVCVYVSAKILGAGGTAWIGEPLADLVQAIQLSHVSIKAFGEDVRICGMPMATAAQT